MFTTIWQSTDFCKFHYDGECDSSQLCMTANRHLKVAAFPAITKPARYLLYGCAVMVLAINAVSAQSINPRNLPTNFTLQMPAGGAGYGALILEGPGREDFLAGLPGMNATQAQSYLQALDTTALAPLTATLLGMRASTRLRIGTRVERALLAHGTGTQYVSSSARMALREALGLANNRVSGHRASCDNFFLFTCQLGDNPTWREESRRQIVTFITSGGVTVTPPGN